MDNAQPRKMEYSWNLDFAVNLGDVHGRFFEGLREKRLVGNSCPECGRRFLPPQPHCDECFVATEEWFDAAPEGVLESYAVTFFQFRNMPEPPYVTGAIRVDDSSTCMLHFVGGIETEDGEAMLEQMESGLKVRPVWREERRGEIEDIVHFEPVG